MALRFNPPPNWPAPPEGFEPPAGWQPDPAWGPAPEGWQIWVDDSAETTPAGPSPSTGPAPSSVPATSSAPGAGPAAPMASSGADPAWAPTQAVQAAPPAAVADPTGASASAPTGDYAPSYSPSAGMAGGAAGTGVGGAGPYAPSGDYAQAPTPFQGQGAPGTPGAPGIPGAPGGWQPAGVPGQPGYAAAASKPVTKQWWFWTVLAVTLVVVLVLGMLAIKGLGSGSDDSSSRGGSGSGTSSSQSGSGGKGGTTEADAVDPDTQFVSFEAGKYEDNPGSSVDVEITQVNWDATQDIKNSKSSSNEPAPDGSVYVRVKVKITYHGSGQFDSYDLKVNYVKDGNSVEPTLMFGMGDEFREAAMPRDGGEAEGYITFIIPEDKVQSGAWVVSAYYGNEEVYFAAK